MLTNTTITKIWVALLGLTVLEVALAFPHLSPVVFLVVLLVLSIGKSAMIVGWFMHLKFESRALTYVLIPFLIVCIGLLMAFLPDAQRLKELRP
ncbi:MAG: cytochrome C oxidase subunit IV family protein [Bryobacteraceae bacterium]